MPVWSRLQRATRGSAEERQYEPTPATGQALGSDGGPALMAHDARRQAHVYSEAAVPHAPSEAGSKTAQLHEWLDSLTLFTGPDSLVDFDPSRPGFLDLSQAHPSGLAQLFAGRTTRVSTLIRDPNQAAEAMRAARLLRSKTQELAAERGIDAGYLAAGSVLWGGDEPLRAPVLLTPVTLQARSGHNDYEIQLVGTPHINPALVRHLLQAHHLTIDPPALAARAFSATRFDPAPVLEHLRALTSSIASVNIEPSLVVGSFADLAHDLHDAPVRAGSGLVPHLCFAAKDIAAGKPRQALRRLRAEDFPSLDSRPPEEDFLVVDADPSQQLVIDAVNAGRSVVAHTPPGTGQTQTALNVIASLAFRGKSVLVVGQRRASLHELMRRFQHIRLDSAVLQLSARTNADHLKKQFVQAIVRNEQAQEPQLDGLHSTLVAQRQQLLDHSASLHTVRPRWGASPYQAMQALAQLTSLSPPPATTVRLKRSVLNAIRDRQEVAAKLARAAQLGSFSRVAAASPWYGARLVTRKETEAAHALTCELAQDFPAFRDKMGEITTFSHLSCGRTFNEWGLQLELLVAIRESLDKFTPDIFDQPVTDLIAATAPSAWRRENNIDMTAMQRSRLRRVAREYIRPGVHIDDLHHSLQQVQYQRQRWAEQATSQRHPVVPSGLAGLVEEYQRLDARLSELAPALEGTVLGGDLTETSAEVLAAHLQVLAADHQALDVLPERSALEEQLREFGLQELLADLAAREVPESLTTAELDLAWWQSVLEAMISGDDYLAMADGGALRTLVADYQLADGAHVSSGSSRLQWKLAQEWGAAVRANPQAAEVFKSMLTEGRLDLASVDAHARPLLFPLTPVWSLSPFLVPSVVPLGRRFDAVVILDAESLPVPAALASLARAGQVVAFGDPAQASAHSFTVAPEGRRGYEDPDAEKQVSVLDALGQVLPVQMLTQVYRCVDEQLGGQLSEDYYEGALSVVPHARSLVQRERALTVEYIPNGTGTPGATGEVEAVSSEVARAVDEVFASVRAHPRSSLAVVTASPLHAARVAEAVRLQVNNYPQLREYFQSTTEPFRVVTIDRLAGLVRDRIIFSLGYGRTPHGRALHDFGLLSQPGGRGRFLAAMTRARDHLTVFSCLKPEELDVAKLSHGAVDFYRFLDRELLHSGEGGAPTAVGGESFSLAHDPLVRDLAQRLVERGARLWYDVGGMIDVVVAPDCARTLTVPWESGAHPLVALEADGSRRCLGMSVRERHRLRPQLLQAFGWQPSSLWAIEVFTDPSPCAERIAREVELPPLPDVERVSFSSGFHSAGAGLSVEEQCQERISAPTPPSLGSESGPEGRIAESGASAAGIDSYRDAPVSALDSPLAARAADDDPRRWGDYSEDVERWYREQRPPHWG